MDQRGHQLGFSVKREKERMTVQRRIQDLDGHGPLQTQLNRPKDSPGASLTNLLLNLKAGDFPGILGGFHFDYRDLTFSAEESAEESGLRSGFEDQGQKTVFWDFHLYQT
jgi:hypothetical protein